MTASWLRARAHLRSRVLASVALTLLLGIGSGAIFTAITGARRSDRALPALLDQVLVNDAAVVNIDADGEVYTAAAQHDDAGRLQTLVAGVPGVARASRVANAVLGVADSDADRRWRVELGVVSIDHGVFDAVGRPIVVRGRAPRDDRLEVVINEELADNLHVDVGGVMQVAPYTVAQFDAAGTGSAIEPGGPRVAVDVVGVVRYPTDLGPRRPVGLTSVDHGVLYLSPEFWRATGPDIGRYGTEILVQLDDGAAGVDRFMAQLGKTSAAPVLNRLQDLLLGYGGESLPAIRRATQVESLALLGFGLVAATVAALIIGQAVRRQLAAEAADATTLHAMGMTGRELRLAALLRMAPVAVGGALLGAVLSVLLSPLTPIGVARRAAPHLGLLVDWPVLAVGSLAVVAAVSLTVWFSTPRSAAASPSARGAFERPTRLTRLAAASAMPTTAALGVRFAAAERIEGKRAVAMRAAVLALASATAALCAAIVFTATLDHVIHTPREFGWGFDAQVGNYSDEASSGRGADLLRADPDVAGYVGVSSGEDITVDGRPTPSMFRVGASERPVDIPVLLSGREPSAGEVALGPLTLDALHKHVGDTVVVRGPRGLDLPVTISGTVLVHEGDPVADPGDGVVADSSLGDRLIPGGASNGPNGYLVSLRPDVDREVALARLRADFFGFVLAEPQLPPGLVNTERVRALPLILGSLLALIAVGTLAHGITVSVHRRRRELAIYRAVGCTQGQIRAIMAWMATTVAVAAIAIGVPAGVVIGRTAWRLTAESIALTSPPRWPWSAIALVALGTTISANAIAALPWVQRSDTVRSLRAE